MITPIKRIITLNNLPIIAQKIINNKKNFDGYIKYDYKNLSVSGSFDYKVFNDNVNHESNLHLLGMNKTEPFVINEKCNIENYDKYNHINYSLKYSVVENSKPYDCVKLHQLDNINFSIYLEHNKSIPNNFWYQLPNNTHKILNDIIEMIESQRNFTK